MTRLIDIYRDAQAHSIPFDVVLTLTACGTSPPARYYALGEPAATSLAKTGDAVVLFGPFDVTPYLQGPQSS